MSYDKQIISLNQQTGCLFKRSAKIKEIKDKNVLYHAISGAKAPGEGVNEPISLVSLFSLAWKHIYLLNIIYVFDIRHHSLNVTNNSNYFCEMENFPNEEINKRSFCNNPPPWRFLHTESWRGKTWAPERKIWVVYCVP